MQPRGVRMLRRAALVVLTITASVVTAAAAATPVYLTIVSHNEEGGLPCYAYVGNPPRYLQAREYLRQLVILIKTKGAKFDWQSDWNFLEAARLYENSTVVSPSSWTATGGKNILRWMKEDMGVSIDPHGHETKYNYADLAWLIEQFGVQSSSVVGGFIYYPADAQVWERFRQPIQASTQTTTSFSWKGDILWGAATVNHVGDDDDASGVWRPNDKNTFGTDDPAGTLVNVGGYDVGSASDGIIPVQPLLDDIASGKAPAGKMYTATKFITQCYYSNTLFQTLSAALDVLQPYVDQGKLIHATLPEVVQAWKNSYGSAANRYDPTPPTVSISSPVAGQVVSGIVALRAGITNAVSARFKLDGVDLGTDIFAAAVATASWNSSGASPGTHILSAQSKNAAGAASASSDITILTVDTQNAVVSVDPNAASVVSLQTSAGAVELFIPPQSFSESVQLTLRRPASCAAASGGMIATDVCTEIVLDKAVQPAKAATLTISYRDSDAAGRDEKKFILARYDDTYRGWVPLESAADPAGNKVTGQTGHFSTFQIMQASPADDLDGARVYPNPFRPAKGHAQVVIDRLPAGAGVSIYTLRGELVWKATASDAGMAVWPGVNQEGQAAASGVYFVYLASGGRRRVIKAAVVR